jgi:hypothetical protein
MFTAMFWSLMADGWRGEASASEDVNGRHTTEDDS